MPLKFNVINRLNYKREGVIKEKGLYQGREVVKKYYFNTFSIKKKL
jgi:hypothetical protein